MAFVGRIGTGLAFGGEGGIHAIDIGSETVIIERTPKFFCRNSGTTRKEFYVK